MTTDALLTVRMSLPRKRAQQLRHLREAFEQTINEERLAAHLKEGGTRAGFKRQRVPLSLVVSRAVEYFLATYDHDLKEIDHAVR